MANRIQLRRRCSAMGKRQPILAGELSRDRYVAYQNGDGVTPWSSLKYERPLETESNTANTLVRDADGNLRRVQLLHR